MTTKIIVMNDGPDSVGVKTAAREKFPGPTPPSMAPTVTLPPKTWKEFFVHSGQDISIFEIND